VSKKAVSPVKKAAPAAPTNQMKKKSTVDMKKGKVSTTFEKPAPKKAKTASAKAKPAAKAKVVPIPQKKRDAKASAKKQMSPTRKAQK